MNLTLTKAVRRLIELDAHLMNQCDGSYYDPLFEEKAELLMEMAKRIEALEQREHSHPLGIGSLQRSMADNEQDSIL